LANRLKAVLAASDSTLFGPQINYGRRRRSRRNGAFFGLRERLREDSDGGNEAAQLGKKRFARTVWDHGVCQWELRRERTTSYDVKQKFHWQRTMHAY
jgi:hypothetical protein